MESVRWNWRPENPVLIDLETQSPVNLKKQGGKAYLSNPATRLLSLVAMFGNSILIWAPKGRYPGVSLNARYKPGEFWPVGVPRNGETITVDDGPRFPDILLDWITAGHTFVAHNASGFDAEAFRAVVAREFGNPQPVSWCDTLPLAKASGLPGALDALGKILTGEGKDSGADALKLMYTAKMKGSECVYPVGTFPLWRSVLQYNVKDVLLMRRVWEEVREAGEPRLLDVHFHINARGIGIDMKLLNNLINLWTEAEKMATDEIVRLTQGELSPDNLRSTPSVKKWLATQGVDLTDKGARKASINRQVLERLYQFPEEFFDADDDIDSKHAFVAEVLRLRQTVTRISKAKLQRIIELADTDNRVRNVLVVYGAHTGRWAGKGFQPHNFARGVPDMDIGPILRESADGSLSIESIRAAIAGCKGNPRIDDALTTVLRPVLRARPGYKLCPVDYAAIEGRGTAWVAGEQHLLDSFARGEDIYCKMAGVIYGRPITAANKAERQVGKVTVLGCGYSMSAPKFAAYCKAGKIDLAAAGTSPEACVEAYREAHPAIAGVLSGKFRRGGIWQKYQKAVRDAVEHGRSTHVGKCDFFMDGPHLKIRLPSGRCLIYRNARMEMAVPAYAAALGLAMEPRPTVRYAHHHGYAADLYGGLVTENIVQAICRDLLAEALIRAEDCQLEVVLHVHDEVVPETEAFQAKQVLQDTCILMSTPPPWATGFPIAVEGFTAEHYVKSPAPGEWVCEARDGVITKLKELQ